MAHEIAIVEVKSTQLEALKDYITSIYRANNDFDSLVHIEKGLNSLMRNEHLACAYFIHLEGEQVGYVVLTRCHRVGKGGLTVYIDEFFVEEKYRRKGIAKRAMEKIRTLVESEGAEALWALRELDDDRAVSFFKSQQFLQNSNLAFELAI